MTNLQSLCGYCKTWNSKPCGEQCHLRPDDPSWEDAAPGVSQQTVAEGIARIIDPEAFEDHFAYQKAANMRKRALVATATANAILSAYPLRDAQQPLGDVFNELVRRMNFDGMNPRTFTLGELRDAIDGAELPK